MDVTESVSKGCFVFKNGFKSKSKIKTASENTSLFQQQFIEEPWYTTFKNIWRKTEKRLNTLNTSTYDEVLVDLVNYVHNCFDHEDYIFYDGIIPSATLLLGINQPDHSNLFNSLKSQLRTKVTPHIAILQSQECSSVKQMIENMIFQFLNTDDNSSNDNVKKINCNMNVLKTWFDNMYSENKNYHKSPSKKTKHPKLKEHLVVVISDFESFNMEALQDFILILSTHTPQLPFILIFGVATSVSALHKSFPYQVSSKLNVQIFQSHSSTIYLNQILDELFLTSKCPFQLSGKIFQLIIDVFLFYDFSVGGFIQNIKFCMMEHFFSSKIMSLCCNKKNIDANVDILNSETLEAIRHLPSFRPYVESSSPSTKIALLTNDDYFKSDIKKCLNSFHDYTYMFYKTLHILLGFIQNLPNSPLGKQIRELYPLCVSSDITSTSEYKQCVLLLNFLSKQEIIELIDKPILQLKKYSLINILKGSKSTKSDLVIMYEQFCTFKQKLNNSSMEMNIIEEKKENINTTNKFDRHSFKKLLIEASQKEKVQSEYDIVKNEFIDYLNGIFKKYLKPPSTQVFHEIFVFNDIHKVKKHIIGAPRASIHTALNNPSAYLQCNCCEISEQDGIVSTMPDLSIAYKLHLECGKLINLYDWLQAFLTIVDPIDDDDADEERREVNPKIQARFTRAVAELQFLGFIKSSKRKTDHVTRLTW